jgi:(S)-2-hydroxyglutarate dehydrogenase
MPPPPSRSSLAFRDDIFPMKICIIGAGIVGLAVARRLHQTHGGAEIVILEKEAAPGRHQSTHNSGVLHAGVYYKPGSLKARMAVSGIRQMVAFCQHHRIPHEICGKLVVATDEAEVGRLRTLQERGTENGLAGLQWLERDAMREIEPHVAGLAGLRVPEEGIVDYEAVCEALARENQQLGTTLYTGARVEKITPDGQAMVVSSRVAEVRTDFVVNCAGLHCDRVAECAGEQRTTRIVPFRGEYYRLGESARHLVRNLVYPVPDPIFPFLGVHFTRLIRGGVEAGPNAVLAFAREGYCKTDINLRDIADAIFFKGLWRFMRRHRAMAWAEVRRSLSKNLFCRSLQKLVPAVQPSDLEPGDAGVRAQAMEESGTLVQDFAFIERERALHVLNAPSPAATASLAIAEEIARRVPWRR